MRIDATRIDVTRTGQNQGVQGGGTDARKQAAQPASPVQRTDRVQISDAGRALAAQRAEAAGEPEKVLSPERVAEIRQRILGGAYNSVEVVEEVARRMLERGDI
jgi:negative regulator of flagellin synthesis FlgM